MTNTTTTTTTTTLNPNIYRFEGLRYQMQAPSTSGFNEIIPQVSSLYSFPKGDQQQTPDK